MPGCNCSCDVILLISSWMLFVCLKWPKSSLDPLGMKPGRGVDKGQLLPGEDPSWDLSP